MKVYRNRHVRRVCAYCQKVRVKKAEHCYCSPACAVAARRKVRPTCPVCRERPRSHQGETCGKVCGGKLRWQRRPRETHATQHMHVAARAAFIKRMAAWLRVELAALESATPEERLKVAIRLYQKGRHDEKAACYYRYVVQARRAESVRATA